MTAMGKMLVILVLVLSIIWNFLVVNAYATRTNWRNEAIKAQTAATNAAESATKMKALLDSERESSEDAKRALREERDRYYAQVAQLLSERDTLAQQYNTAFADSQKRSAIATDLAANRAALQGQVKELDDKLKRIEVAMNDLILERDKFKVEANTAKISEAAKTQQAERLGDLLTKANEELAEARRPGGGVPGQRTVPAPVGFRGTVTGRDGNLISLNVGLDAGLQKGTALRVERMGANPKYLGKITILTANQKIAVGQYEKPAGVSAEDFPKPGDQVRPADGQ